MMENPKYTNGTEFRKALRENPFTAEARRELYDYLDGASMSDEGARWADTQFESLDKISDYTPLAGRLVIRNSKFENA